MSDKKVQTFFSRVSQSLILVASAWLLVSWAMNLAIDAPVRLNAGTMRPAVRWMLMSSVLGLFVAWPAWRLSQGRLDQVAKLVWIDMLCLFLVFQVVLWPLRLLVRWPMGLAWMINFVMMAWTLVVGLCVYFGLREQRGVMRCLWLMVSLMLMMGGVLLGWLGWGGLVGDGEMVGMNAFSMLWAITSPRGVSGLSEVFHQAAWVGLIGLLGWVIVSIREGRTGRGRMAISR